ncbi:hypothetical protein F7731_26055 [Cytobacillus depressus]|uniref:Uncharacterized protein n=1 Tax=Cytobacillus depressus TaxID=1602942 RepID=A0A6L3V3E1_9BACI|nr:hypothetical protein [Cytobacillus depressus]KAB2328080.1 hypothetical protein F7731_26055 [Cytobacillus depressus]
MKRLVTVVLSVALFASIFSWIFYVPVSLREPNVYYSGFLETFIFVIIYAGPIYLLAGLPLSIFIDKLIEKSNRKSKWAKCFLGLGLYSLFGIFVGVIFLFLFIGNIYSQENFTVSIYGIIASNVYYHLLILVSKISKK